MRPMMSSSSSHTFPLDVKSFAASLEDKLRCALTRLWHANPAPDYPTPPPQSPRDSQATACDVPEFLPPGGFFRDCAIYEDASATLTACSSAEKVMEAAPIRRGKILDPLPNFDTDEFAALPACKVALPCSASSTLSFVPLSPPPAHHNPRKRSPVIGPYDDVPDHLKYHSSGPVRFRF